MATKQLTVVRAGRYGTRMLQAGDVFDASAPEARLFEKLGWMTAAKPKAAVTDAEAIQRDIASFPAPKPTTVKTGGPRKRKAKKTA